MELVVSREQVCCEDLVVGRSRKVTTGLISSSHRSEPVLYRRRTRPTRARAASRRADWPAPRSRGSSTLGGSFASSPSAGAASDGAEHGEDKEQARLQDEANLQDRVTAELGNRQVAATGSASYQPGGSSSAVQEQAGCRHARTRLLTIAFLRPQAVEIVADGLLTGTTQIPGYGPGAVEIACSPKRASPEIPT